MTRTQREEDFLERAAAKFGSRFDFSRARYIDADHRISVTCPVHGAFERTPKKLLASAHGCPACGRANRCHSVAGAARPSAKLSYQRANAELYREATRRSRQRIRDTEPERYAAMLEAQVPRQRAWLTTDKGRAHGRLQRQRRRARERDALAEGLTPRQWDAICAAQTNELGQVCCRYCKRPCSPTIEHVVPIARGGRHEPSNIVAACSSCNSSKADRLLIEWPRARRLLDAAELLALTSTATD